MQAADAFGFCQKGWWEQRKRRDCFIAVWMLLCVFKKGDLLLLTLARPQESGTHCFQRSHQEIMHTPALLSCRNNLVILNCTGEWRVGTGCLKMIGPTRATALLTLHCTLIQKRKLNVWATSTLAVRNPLVGDNSTAVISGRGFVVLLEAVFHMLMRNKSTAKTRHQPVDVSRAYLEVEM